MQFHGNIHITSDMRTEEIVVTRDSQYGPTTERRLPVGQLFDVGLDKDGSPVVKAAAVMTNKEILNAVCEFTDDAGYVFKERHRKQSTRPTDESVSQRLAAMKRMQLDTTTNTNQGKKSQGASKMKFNEQSFDAFVKDKIECGVNYLFFTNIDERNKLDAVPCLSYALWHGHEGSGLRPMGSDPRARLEIVIVRLVLNCILFDEDFVDFLVTTLSKKGRNSSPMEAKGVLALRRHCVDFLNVAKAVFNHGDLSCLDEVMIATVKKRLREINATDAKGNIIVKYQTTQPHEEITNDPTAN